MARRPTLSRRQRQVIRLTCLGYTQRQIVAKTRLSIQEIAECKREAEFELGGIVGVALLTRMAIKLKIIAPNDDLKYKEHGRDLSDRQRQILRLVSLGCSSVEIAKILRLSRGTIEAHKRTVASKLGVHGTASLTRLAYKLKITSAQDKLTRAEQSKRGKRKDGWN